jgi:hypothetical protein
MRWPAFKPHGVKFFDKAIIAGGAATLRREANN